MKSLRKKFENNVLLGYININSIRNKLLGLFSVLENDFDILSIAETKLDLSFPNSQFSIKGYKSPIRLDVSDCSGGLMVYVKNGLSIIHLKGFVLPKDIQIIPLQVNLQNCKWLILSVYRPPSLDITYFLQFLTDMIDFYSFERYIVIGDINSDPKCGKLDYFLESHVLHNHVKSNTCFKSLTGSCIDLILSNQKFSLQGTGSFDCGLSDHHHLIYTMLKSTYSKLPPKKVFYRCYKRFSDNDFLNDLNFELSNNLSESNFDYDYFESLFELVLDRHAPLKSKCIRGNEKPHMNKGLKKAIMNRTRLWNIYCKTKSSTDLRAYREQRNLITKMNKKAKFDHFDRTIEASKNNCKAFWKSCKPFLSKSSPVENEISLNHNGQVIQNCSEIANIFNTHFSEVTKSLNLLDLNQLFSSEKTDPVFCAINKFKSHPSIVKIKYDTTGLPGPFKFREVTVKEVQDLIMKLDCTKKTGGQISAKLLKLSSKFVCNFIRDSINQSFRSGRFPNRLKLAEIIPIPKKGDSHSVGDYRPISILPTISKVFEKAMANQLSKFFESKFSDILCGFRKGHSTQHALVVLLRSWQKSLDEGKIVGTVLMDLSKAYDCLPHDLLIAKLSAYGVDLKSLRLLHDYLLNRFQRVRIGSCCSKWKKITSGVPQGSILGPLLFNVFLNDFFMFIKEAGLCNFADDNSLHVSDPSLDQVKRILERESSKSLYWFKINSMAANPAKFQTMFLGIRDYEIILNFDGITVKSTSTVKLLGVLLDSKLNFSAHVKSLCKSASQKTSALLRIRPFLNISCAKRLCSAYILSIFNYCPIIWMFGSKANNGLINKVQKRALRAIYKDFESPFELLLERNKSVAIHVQNLRTLMLEVFKCVKLLSPRIMWDMFLPKTSRYALRSGINLKLPETRTQRFGINSLVFRGSITWNSLPPSLKSAGSIEIFKSCIKSWDGKTCHCLICK